MNLIEKIVLDRSQVFSTQHGTRMPDDPWYKVAFVQNGLPFDFNGHLVPDDGRRDPWDAVVDGQRIRYIPLWDEKMRRRLENMLKRLEGHLIPDEESMPELMSAEEKALIVNDVNLVMWLKGELKYEPWQIFEATKKRTGTNCHTLSAAIEALVLDHNVISEDELSPRLRALCPVLKNQGK